MNIRDLFADELTGGQAQALTPKPVKKSVDGRGRPDGYSALVDYLEAGPKKREDVPPEFAGGKDMEKYDRELFEGLFLRYGKAWVNREMARLITKFPSYRKD